MDSANSLRRLNKLWKDRHTHTDDDSDLEQRIIRIETGVDTVYNHTGAYIHLVGDSQTVDDDQVEWSSLLKVPYAFSVDFPSSEVTIQESGYYCFHVDLEWSDHHGGGDVWLTRTRGELTETVWPPFGTTGLWSSPGGSRFVDTVPAVACEPGDVFELWADTGGAQTVSQAVMVPYLVDRSGRAAASSPSGEPDLAFESFAISIGATTSYDVPLPESQAGDLLVMIVGSNNTPSVSGWTQLVTKATSGSQATVLWKVASGSEGTQATVTFGSATGIEMASFRFRLTGVNWASQPPSASIDYENSSPMDFPTAAPTHGAGSYWVVIFCAHTFNIIPTSTPAAYPQILNATHVHSTGKLWAGAAFEGVSGSISPGQFEIGGSGNAHLGVLFVKGV